MTNAEPIADMLERYIDSLQDILSEIKDHQGNAIYKLFEKPGITAIPLLTVPKVL